MPRQPLIVGRPALLVIDIQKAAFLTGYDGGIALMPGFAQRMLAARPVIDAARAAGAPVIFFQEAHRPSGVDFGRELDGAEGVHCVEDAPGTALAVEETGFRPDDLFIRKRRYSCFFGTELQILLRGLKVDTLLLVGALTDVCVHYTFVDGHQHDYHCRVAEDAVAGSSPAAHDAALAAMEYLQAGAVRRAADFVAALADLRAAA